MAESNPSRLLLWAGALTWAVAGGETVASWASGRARFDGRAIVWLAAYVAFAAAFLAATERLGPWSRVARIAALAVQTMAALVVVRLGDSGAEGALLCIVAGEAPFLLGGGAAFGWVLTQVAAMLALELSAWGSVRGVYLSTAAYAGFQLFACGASRLTAREAAGRNELARVHAELLATQELFADSTRTAERLRIARELHDSLGHHLTALSLQLELARNVADGRAKEPVDQAHALTKELLGELRSVVGAMREDQPIDLAGALRTLVAGISTPHVELDVAEGLRVEPALAHAIFRCVQEALTNAVRHAAAENVFLTIEEQRGSIAVIARDDGRGVASVKAGFGLTGLRERIEGMGGEIELVSQPGRGVTVRALLPLRRSEGTV